ncbi:hypothetical protein BG004_002305 [Podila humilis]|nr:hypothetical protein BG004_002305 [Podila humilis]
MAKNYPLFINFDELEARVEGMKDELRGIVEGTVYSKYLEQANKIYKSLGAMGARQTQVMMNTLRETIPGYYGSKGSAELFEILAQMFIKSGILTFDLAKPQRPSEYVQQVLIPETGSRLILQDLKQSGNAVTMEQARIIMAESAEFGSYVHES